MQHVIDEINSKFTFSITDDKISVHNKKEVAYVELTTIDDIVYIENSFTLPEFQKNNLNLSQLLNFESDLRCALYFDAGGYYLDSPF